MADYYINELLGLQGTYEVVHDVNKAHDEPFSDEGDLDGDGLTNHEEFEGVLRLMMPGCWGMLLGGFGWWFVFGLGGA